MQDSGSTPDHYRATGAKPEWPRPENAGRDRDQEEAEQAELMHDFPRWRVVQVFGGWLAVERPAEIVQAMFLSTLRELLAAAETGRREQARRDVTT